MTDAALRGSPRSHPTGAGQPGNPVRRFLRELLALLDGLFDGADHIEGLLGQMVVLAFAEVAKTLDGVGKVDELAGRAGEDFGDEERLRQEALDLAGAGDRGLV